MVVYDLNCSSGHAFEGWFRNAGAFGEQLARGQLACPVCRSTEVTRRPSASRINRGTGSPQPSPGPVPEGGLPVPHQQAAQVMARALHHFVERHFEDVGHRFASEARRMHYGEAEERNIRGTASADEVRDLHDEGIEARTLPDLDAGKPN